MGTHYCYYAWNVLSIHSYNFASFFLPFFLLLVFHSYKTILFIIWPNELEQLQPGILGYHFHQLFANSGESMLPWGFFGKLQFCLHFVVVALSPVEQRQWLLAKTFAIPCVLHKFIGSLFMLAICLTLTCTSMQKFWRALGYLQDTQMTLYNKCWWPEDGEKEIHRSCGWMLKQNL
jgi:hypothetical protein